MTKIKTIGLGILCIMALSGCQKQTMTATAEYIGIEAAKEAAVKSAGIAEEQADFSTAGLDNRDGTFFYQVNFSADGVEYEYAIDAVTGVVIEESSGADETTGAASSAEETAGETSEAQSAFPEEANEGQQAVATAGAGEEQAVAPAETSAPANIGTQQSASQNSGMIGEDKAKEIALSHAGLTEEQVQFVKVKRDYDDGRSIYEVEFYGEGADEYDYEIDAITGEIVAFDSELHDRNGSAPSEGQSPVSEDEVRATVLERVPGASAENLFLRLEMDDGRLEYEGELIYDNMEYEFKVDAYSGNVMEWEAEQIRR